MNDNLKNLYNTLVKSGYNPPAFDQFVKDMQDEKNLQGVYSTLKKEGYTPPSFERFRIDMGFGTAAKGPGTPGKAGAAGPAGAAVTAGAAGKAGAAGTPGPARGDKAAPAPGVPAVQGNNRGQGGWKPSWQQQMAMEMQLGETLQKAKQSERDFNTRMENLRKGNSMVHTSEMKLDPASGKMQRRYYTTHGDEVATQLEQSLLNTQYQNEWETTTPEGRRHREKRME